MATKIQWTDETWNPVVGCTKVSAGCKNCYAERMAWRLRGMAKHYRHLYPNSGKYESVMDAESHKWNGSVYCDESALDKPLHWRDPRRVFICSMGDLFHKAVPFSFIGKVMGVIEQCPQHTFQILTKRPQIMADYYNGLGKQFELSCCPNLWGGVTVENQDNVGRIADLLRCGRTDLGRSGGFAVNFVSAEPLLGPIAMTFSLRDVIPDWLIVGPETGPGRRPCRIEWVKDLVAQADAAGVSVFIKALDLGGKKPSTNMDEWPDWAQGRREYPKSGQK